MKLFILIKPLINLAFAAVGISAAVVTVGKIDMTPKAALQLARETHEMQHGTTELIRNTAIRCTEAEQQMADIQRTLHTLQRRPAPAQTGDTMTVIFQGPDSIAEFLRNAMQRKKI
jgi:hypothetical protein